MLSFHLRLGRYIPGGFITKILHSSLVSSILAACPAHRNILTILINCISYHLYDSITILVEYRIYILNDRWILMRLQFSYFFIFRGSDLCLFRINPETVNPSSHLVGLPGWLIGQTRGLFTQEVANMSIPWMWFEPATREFERSKPLRASGSDRFHFNWTTSGSDSFHFNWTTSGSDRFPFNWTTCGIYFLNCEIIFTDFITFSFLRSQLTDGRIW
jgi:hypothetical protein